MWAWAAVLALALARHQAAAQPDWRTVSGQGLVDEVARWGSLNADATYEWPAGNTIISLAGDAPFNTSRGGGRTYAAGTLMLKGVQSFASNSVLNATSSSVLDTAGRTGLTPILITSGLQIVDVSLVNLCHLSVFVGPGLTITTPLLLGIFSLNPVVKALKVDRVILYVPQSTLALSTYLGIMSSVSMWPQVTGAFSRQSGSLASIAGNLTPRQGAYEMVAGIYSSPMMEGNVTYRSTSMPGDPLMAFMRRQGSLMAPRWCNGTQMPAALAASPIDPIWGPIWMVDTAAGAAEGLVNATALAPVQQAAGRPVAGVQFFAPTFPLGDALLPAGALQLAGALLLAGPLNDDRLLLVPRLDLTNRTAPLFTVTGNGLVYAFRVAFKAPARPVTALAALPFDSALPLSTLASTADPTASPTSNVASAASTRLVELHNCTVEVPALDFAALLTLATDGSNASVRACMDLDTVAHAARLMTGIQVLKFDNGTFDLLNLGLYTGWGVNASWLIVRPQTPLPDDMVQRCRVAPADAPGINNILAYPPPPSSSTGGGSSAPVGAIVGGVVGGVVLLAALLAAVVLVRRRRQRRHDAEHQSLRKRSPDQPDSPPKLHVPLTRPPEAVSLTIKPASSGAATAAGAGGNTQPNSNATNSTTQAGTSTTTAAAAAVAAKGQRSATTVATTADIVVTADDPNPSPQGPQSLLVMLHQKERQLLKLPRTRPKPLPKEAREAAAAEVAGAAKPPQQQQQQQTEKQLAEKKSGGSDKARQQKQQQQQQQEQQSGGDNAADYATDLTQVHEALMSLLVGAGAAQAAGRAASGSTGEGGASKETPRNAGGGTSAATGTASKEEEERSARSSAPGSSATADPWSNVREVAQRLQGQGPGDSADTVTLQQVLGRGGSAIVYLGLWRGLPVAVKTMVFEAWEGEVVWPGTVGTSSRNQLRYVRAIMETAIAASVGHRHVVATYKYDIKRVDDDLEAELAAAAGGVQVSGEGQSSATALDITRSTTSAGVHAYKVFLVQELCTCSLRSVLQHGVLAQEPEAQRMGTILSLLHQVACGLEYLHGLGIIHGDLTPSNILLKVDEAAPGGAVVKLADFGLSMRLDAQATHVSGFGAGTPFYVAPEVAIQRRSAPASDVYSFGVVAWEVCTGLVPYVTTPEGAHHRSPQLGTYAGLASLEPPSDLEKLFRRCLHAEARQRPTAGQLVAALLRHVPPPPRNSAAAQPPTEQK